MTIGPLFRPGRSLAGRAAQDLGPPALGSLHSCAPGERRPAALSPGRKAALLRRVSLDLTGLPPTLAEEQAFLADASPNAYEKQVDRLLASPRYGERWASMWLDLARYADTKGYEKDVSRPGMWPYRDWVIDAFNRNLPYDQFVLKQLAGDLLPNPTFEDRIATSFHRQTPNNDEGGTDDEEFRLVAVMDRVATTWSVLNGVTMNCVQCHSHPYDPIRHADYYKSLAFFNTQEDSDLDDDSPNMTVPKDRARYPEAAAMQKEIEDLIHNLETSDRQLVEKTRWRPLPVQVADANEAPAIEQVIPQLNRTLENVQQARHRRRLHPRLTQFSVCASPFRRPRQGSIMPRSRVLRRLSTFSPGRCLQTPKFLLSLSMS